MLAYIEYLGIPMQIGIGIIGFLVVTNLIGEFLELTGRVVPEFIKMRKFFARKKAEKQEAAQTLKEVKALLGEVNSHYSADNITKRDTWMTWVNNQAAVYDNSIVEITSKLTDVTQALKENTRMTEEMFIQSSRDRIIDFATKVGNHDVMVSREEFNRIFKVYNNYETFLEDRKLTNGEIDIAYRIIKESYEHHLKNHSFIEDIRGYHSESV